MRILTGNALVLTSIAAGLIAASCGTPCEDTHSCGTYNPTGGSGGSAAAAGAAGNSGASGHSSAGAGVGGSSAEGGQAGSDAGSSALGGAAGTSAAGRGGSGGGAGSAGTDNGGGQGGAAPTCDETQSPADEACLVSNEYAIFVSPSGDDGGSGKKTDPVKTLAKALRVAHDASKIVVACSSAGSFSEQVSVTEALDGSRLYGGFDCDTWKYDANQKTTVASAETTALRIDNLTDGVTIEDFAFEAADATMPGESSVGAFVTSSANVVFRRTRIEAGKGHPGANGVLDPFTYKERSELNGNNATGTAGAMELVCACQAALMTSGGIGGTGSLSGQNGSAGTPDFDGPGGEGGDATKSCSMGGAGANGADAPKKLPALGADVPGTLTSTGWTPAPGSDGQDGSPGQGGGGGASSATGGGGGGGCGSCGGVGGPAGQGGGASIALISFKSGVSLEEQSALVADDAGRGGNGVAGQLAQAEAGFGGNGAQSTGACQGGSGGLGADGQAGGGAAGGISVGILWKGDAEPVRKGGVTFTEGTPGAKGVGGSVGVNDGIDGLAQDVYAAP
jgi:hypothetical protein